ncbi:MAG TPA: 3-oxoadipate enol-lactonase [Chloroflexia bacterium]|nr:3-oxoadipate enol-lactonase [Chloroflexia bacterium]
MRYITASDGVTLACREDGGESLPALVFSNSLGTAMHVWDPQVEALRTHFRIIRYDIPGHGQSSVPSQPATIERLGEDLLAVLDAYGLERAHICGLSLGGLTALWLAATHPERVSRAVFANTAARIGSSETWNARIEAVRAGGMASVRDAVVSRFLSPGFQARDPGTTGRFGDMVEATDPGGYIAACAALATTDLRPIVPNITAPSLIISGALDEATPPSQAAELHRAIPGSEMAALDAAHLSSLEQPTAFNALLLRFLAPEAPR